MFFGFHVLLYRDLGFVILRRDDLIFSVLSGQLRKACQSERKYENAGKIFHRLPSFGMKFSRA